MRAEAVSSHLFLRSVNHYTLSGVCEKRWRRNQAGGRLRRFHLPLSLSHYPLSTPSLIPYPLSLSLSRTLTKETALVSRGSDWLHDESTDTPNTMRQQHGSHLLKALHTHRLKVELVHHQTYRHICSVELPT